MSRAESVRLYVQKRVVCAVSSVLQAFACVEVPAMTVRPFPLFAYQSAVGRSCLELMATTVGSYGSLLDPRPDLAVPARRIRLAYAWWW
jgi:hypothetical protein